MQNMECSAYHTIPMVVLLLLMSTCDCQKQIFYITSSDSSHCPQEASASQCYDLPTLVSEGHLSMGLNTSLLFLPGEHFLMQDLEMKNLRQFQMTSYNGKGISSESGVTITCTNHGGHSITMQHVSSVEINSISFQSCGVNGNSSGVLQLRSVGHSEITNCKWYESRSSAIFIEDSSSVISDCQLMRGNCCSCSGGGIHADSSNITFTGSNVVANNSVLAGNGGGLSLTNCDVHVYGYLTVNGNIAASGNGIFVENCSFTTTNTSFLLVENNRAQYGGGQLISSSQCVYSGQVEFSDDSTGRVFNSNCTFNGQLEFSNNSADIGGGMGVFNSNCTFNGQLEFSNNSADIGGGMAVSNSSCTFNGPLEFSNNTAGGGGGGMGVHYSNCNFNEQLKFSNNSAGVGGGMRVDNSNCTFNEQLEFSNNSATNSGGMEVFNSSCNFNEQLKFSNNSAGVGGGGMSLYYSNCAINEQLEVSNNSAGVGGGMRVSNSNCIFNEQLEFSNNSANNSGGMGVFNSGCTFNGQLEFSYNSADFGGGMGVFDDSNCTFNGQLEFSYNSADFGGGMGVFNSNCTFNEQLEFSNNSVVYFGGGMEVIISTCTFNEQLEFSSNSADRGGGMGVFNSDCTFNYGQLEFSDNSAHSGGGMEVYNSGCTFNGQLEFSNNSANLGGGMRVITNSVCIFKDEVLFSGNSAGSYGGSLLAEAESSIIFLSLVNISTGRAGREGGGILVRNDSLLVMDNETIMNDNHALFYGGAVSLDTSDFQMRGNSKITGNSAQYGGAIQAVASKLYISGDHLFESNSGDYGGGWALFGGSLVYFLGIGQYPVIGITVFLYCMPEDLNVQFISNHAKQYGGAIWVENNPYYSCTNDEGNPQCFIGFDYTIVSYIQYCNISSSLLGKDNNYSYSFTARDNTAITGNSVYGGNIDSCPDDIKRKLLKYLLNKTTANSISSDAFQVCLCNDRKPDCSISDHYIEAFSGEQLQLTLVGVGEKNGAVPAVIRSHTDPPGSSDNGSLIQSAPEDCRILFYKITSDKTSVKLILYPENSCPENSLRMLRVHVNIKPCPSGFMLDKSCVCDNTLKKLDSSIECDIDSQTFTHQHGVWIGYNQLNGTVIYHPHCPFDYCTQQLSTFTLNDTDRQCRYNRSGLICGACNEGYSLTLGGSKCRECSNFFLFLILPLALAGVVLVLFLLTFKLTVSMGTINGLIFFANIIGTNSSIFLPPESTVVLRVFIAWLNLDLGIDICLFDGMDMYTKVWLQFVFPFYVFTLIGIIIFVSHSSILVTKLLGSDPVALLATLILVAYTKLFRTVLTVMSFTYIRGFDGSSIAVWLYDGNVRYLSGKHIPLFIFALLILLLLIIPYTVILLFAPYLQRCSRNKLLFINDYRIKSFLNSYYAPLKDKYRSWVGLLLVLRLCLLIVFLSNSLGDPSVNLFAIVIVVVVLFSWRMLSGTVYTNQYLDALETYFFMKLCLFSVSSLYVLHTSGNQRALADTLVGIAFIVFVAITVYHGWRELTDSRWWRLTLKPKWQKHFNSGNEEGPVLQEDSDECEEPQTPPQVSTTYIDRPKPHPQAPATFIDLSQTPQALTTPTEPVMDSTTLIEVHESEIDSSTHIDNQIHQATSPTELQEPILSSTTPTDLYEPVIDTTTLIEVHESVTDLITLTELQDPLPSSTTPADLREPVIDLTTPVEVHESVMDLTMSIELQEPILNSSKLREPVLDFC